MRVVVEGGSRLHAGFHTIDPASGIWGGSGFYSQRPRVVVEAWECSEHEIRAPADIASLVSKLGFEGGCAQVVEAPPRHSGLGSTTQVSLALAYALSRVVGENLDLFRAAVMMGRGRFSWVGTLLAKHGGFVVDAGSGGEPSAITLSPIPSSWRLLIVIPELDRGLSEEEESILMKRLRSPSPKHESMMARGTLKLALGVVRGDLELALVGLREVQLGTGMYFASSQGGVYRVDAARIVDEASRSGIYLAQSSWGPTLYTITDSEKARSDASLLRGILRELGYRGDIIISEPRNTGLSLETLE